MNVGLRLLSGWLFAGMMGAGGQAPTRAAPSRQVSDTVGADTAAKLICADASGIRFEMRFMTPRQSAYTANRFAVMIGRGQYQEVVSGEYLLMTNMPNALPNCGTFVTPTSGVMPVTIEVRDGTGSLASLVHPQARIHFELPLKPSWVWGVMLIVSPVGERTDLPRFGPADSYAQTVALPGGDSLFVHVIGYDPVKAAHVVY